MDQGIRYCTSKDGVRIAYATTGAGPPVVRVLGWLTHLEFEQTGPFWQPWRDYLATGRQLVRYDSRGIGLSDREVTDFSLEAKVGDLEAVVDSLTLQRFDLVGTSEGGSTAIAYAVRHPERVRRLVLYESAGAHMGGDPLGAEKIDALGKLFRSFWGQDSPAARQFFTDLNYPDGDDGFRAWYNELQRVSATPEVAARFVQAFAGVDVRNLLPSVQTPTLVVHRRGDMICPFEAGRGLAAAILGARFLPFEGRNHLPLAHEPEQKLIYEAIAAFLAQADAVAGCPASTGSTATPIRDQDRLPAGITVREADVLRLIAAGKSTREIADRLVISEGTVERHVTNLYDKIGARSRAEATAYAFRHGLAPDAPAAD